MKNLKAYAALAGSMATGLLGVYAADTEVGKVLTVVSILSTAIVTWAVPNTYPPTEPGDAGIMAED